MKYTLASRILQKLAANPQAHASDATADTLRAMYDRLGGCGGALSLSPAGHLGIAFTTSRMAWAMQSVQSGGVRSGIDRASDGGKGEDDAGRVEIVDVGHPRTEHNGRVTTRVKVVTDPATGLKVRVREKVRGS